jgi:hypothetical protein
MITLDPLLVELIAQPMSPAAAAIVADIKARAEREVCVAVPRQVSQEMQHIGPSRQIELENAGELRSYLDGSRRLVTTASIYARLIRRAIESHPVDGPPARVRRPSTRYQRHRRQPTPQELEGLKRGNERRKREAEARRASTRREAAARESSKSKEENAEIA